MALVLHLTDLHLGAKHPKFLIDDYKSDIVDYPERETRHKLLANTLAQLIQSDQVPAFDAVVVSGDITVANSADGFEHLPVLLSSLGDKLPPEDRIMVVPGNHDVQWLTESGSVSRYKQFISNVRDRGYITPLLDGIDFDRATGEPLSGSRSPVIELDDGAIQLIAMNTSNWSGSLEKSVSDEDWKLVLGAIKGPGAVQRRENLKRLRVYDAARVSSRQLQLIADHLGTLTPADANPVRIMAMHHHLLPVSSHEEVKPFESLTNLGLVRAFIKSNNIRVVLHGHKHVGRVYWDHVYDEEIGDRIGDGHRVLVISGSTLGGQDYSESEVARFVSVDANSSSPTAASTPIAGITPGSGDFHGRVDSHRFFLDRGHVSVPRRERPIVVEGVTTDEIYDRLIVLFADRLPDIDYPIVICTLKNDSTRPGIPKNYPPIDGITSAEDLERWTGELALWLQKQRRHIHRAPHTHGQRMYKYWSGIGPIDQIERATKALAAKAETSRAVVTLFNPLMDDPSNPESHFPSFSQLHLWIDGDKLNMAAYFRRQEMRYWWLINVTELCQLRSTIITDLRKLERKVKPGLIVTFAAMGHLGDSPPDFPFPKIDRLFDDNPLEIVDLALGLAALSDPAQLLDDSSRQKIQDQWLAIIGDLALNVNNALMVQPSLAGFDYLRKVFERDFFPRSAAIDDLEELIERITEKLRLVAVYSKTEGDDAAAALEDVKALVNSLGQQMGMIFVEADARYVKARELLS